MNYKQIEDSVQVLHCSRPFDPDCLLLLFRPEYGRYERVDKQELARVLDDTHELCFVIVHVYKNVRKLKKSIACSRIVCIHHVACII